MIRTINQKKRSVLKKQIVILALFLLFTSLFPIGIDGEISAAKADSVNLIKGSSFETQEDMGFWHFWKGVDATRNYDFYRAFSSPIGYGSYSAGFEPSGAAGGRYSAGLVGSEKNTFSVESGKEYYFSFYANADSAADVSIFIEDSSSFEAITDTVEKNIRIGWNKYSVIFTPRASGSALITFAFGDLAEGNKFYLDGLSLQPYSFSLTTDEVKGYIGDKNKVLQFKNLNNASISDIEIELPFFNAQSGEIERKKFHPESVSGDKVFFDFYDQTFAGFGTVYFEGNVLGHFTYNIIPQITDFNPSQIRVGETVAVTGTGFSPIPNTTYLILKITDGKGKKYDSWVNFSFMDSKLTLASFNLPIGVAPDRLAVSTSFWDKDGNSTANKSNSLNYTVRPVITALGWSNKGFDQAGDKLEIQGRGLSYNPVVKFYDDNGKTIYSQRASVKSIDSIEKIEAATPKNVVNLKVAVVVENVESEQENIFEYFAKPRLNSIAASKSRVLNESKEKIPAAKIGEEITLSGDAFYSSGQQIYVNFTGQTGIIRVAASADKVDLNGKRIKVAVPSGALNGPVSVELSGLQSNAIYIEIIPTIVSVSTPFVPGNEIYIYAAGMGDNIEMAKVYFILNGGKEQAVKPDVIKYSGTSAVISVKAPLAISSNSSSVSVQYGNWRDNGSYNLSVGPSISGASIDMDTRILTIRGYGFNANMRDNKITYKYSDQDKTVIDPKASLLGVFATDEGQEIRIKISDDYYYGYVTVTVGDLTSNEANFGPVSIKRIDRRVEFVKSVGREMGVLYISGYNFGESGGIKVGDVWADIHYRNRFFVIAVVEKANVYDNPVIVAK